MCAVLVDMSNYESFLEDSIPRSIPLPSPYIQNGVKAIVPEVSLMFDKPSTRSTNFAYGSCIEQPNIVTNFGISDNVTVPICVENYQRGNNLPSPSVLKSNIAPISNIRRKQVRFESQPCSSTVKSIQSDSQVCPTEKNNLSLSRMVTKSDGVLNTQTSNCCQTRPISYSNTNQQYLGTNLLSGNISFKTVGSTNSANNCYGQYVNLNSTKSNSKLNPIISNDLDLSILEVPVSKKQCQKQVLKYTEQQTPVPSYRQFKELYYASIPENNVASSSHYQASPNVVSNILPKTDISIKGTAAENKSQNKENDLNNSNNIDATVSELYKIVKLQNEQLQCLQEQVQKLLVCQEKEVMHAIPKKTQEENIDLIQKVNEIPDTENAQLPANQNVKRISIGVMTSLQVSFDCVQSRNSTNPSTENHTQEIKTNDHDHVNDNNTTQNDLPNDSFTIHDIAVESIVRDSLSPVNTPQVQITEYNDSEDECSESHGQMSVLKDAMINNIHNLLETSPTPNMDQYVDHIIEKKTDNSSKKLTLPENVAFTVDQLKQMGVNLTDVNISSERRVTFDSSYNPKMLNNIENSPSRALTDQSLAINAMGLKYFRGEDLGQFVATKQLPFPNLPIQPNSENDKSLATIKYMEKYRILKQTQTYRVPRNSSVPNQNCRVLDITNLKQQTKLP